MRSANNGFWALIHCGIDIAAGMWRWSWHDRLQNGRRRTAAKYYPCEFLEPRAMLSTQNFTAVSIEAPAKANWDSEIVVELTVQYTGATSISGYDVAILLSFDSTISGFDTRLGEFRRSGTLFNGSPYDTFSVTVTLPEGALSQHYYIGMSVDPKGEFRNNSAADDKKSIPILLTDVPAGKPDLVATGINAPATVKLGTQVRVSSTFRNGGETAAATFNYRYEIVDATEKVVYKFGKLTAPDLRSGSSHVESPFLRIPVNLRPGNYSLRLVLDVDNVINENSEANNVSSTAFRIAANNNFADATPLAIDLDDLGFSVDETFLSGRFDRHYYSFVATVNGHLALILSVKNCIVSVYNSDRTLIATKSGVSGFLGFREPVRAGKSYFITFSPLPNTDAPFSYDFGGHLAPGDPTISIGATNAIRSEGNSGETEFTFIISRDGDTRRRVAVDVSVVGTGTSPVSRWDFPGTALPSGRIVLEAGESQRVITVYVLGDTIGEATETFRVVLSNPSVGATIKTASANGRIRNDDRPKVVSFKRLTPATTPTSSNTLVFRATFNQPVYNVHPADFKLSGSTARITRIEAVAGSRGTQFDVTVSGGNLAYFNGVVNLSLATNPTINDLAGNLILKKEPRFDEAYVIDNSAPILRSFVRRTPTSLKTSANVLVFRATFSEAVEGPGVSDFIVIGTTAKVTSVRVVSGSRRTQFDVTVAGGNLATLRGTVGLNLSANPTVFDVVGNALLKREPAVDRTFLLDPLY